MKITLFANSFPEQWKSARQQRAARGESIQRQLKTGLEGPIRIQATKRHANQERDVVASLWSSLDSPWSFTIMASPES